MPAPDRASWTLVTTYQRSHEQLLDQLAAAAGRVWRRVGPVEDAQLAAWLDGVLPVVEAGRRRAAGSAVAYLSAYLERAGLAAPLVDVDAVAAAVREGVPLDEVYSRPVITVRSALSDGAPLGDALREGAARAVMTIRTDAGLAARDASHEVLSRSRVVGYRRVTDGNACELCVLASTQRYHRGDLSPIHPACGCSVVPIIGDRDPGHVIDRDAVAWLKASGASTDGLPLGERYRQAVAVSTHGEYGPTLHAAGDHFTGPAGF